MDKRGRLSRERRPADRLPSITSRTGQRKGADAASRHEQSCCAQPCCEVVNQRRRCAAHGLRIPGASRRPETIALPAPGASFSYPSHGYDAADDECHASARRAGLRRNGPSMSGCSRRKPTARRATTGESFEVSSGSARRSSRAPFAHSNVGSVSNACSPVGCLAQRRTTESSPGAFGPSVRFSDRTCSRVERLWVRAF